MIYYFKQKLFMNKNGQFYNNLKTREIARQEKKKERKKRNRKENNGQSVEFYYSPRTVS